MCEHLLTWEVLTNVQVLGENILAIKISFDV